MKKLTLYPLPLGAAEKAGFSQAGGMSVRSEGDT